MTSWTVLSDADLTANKPLTQSKARALRDNPIALSEGASGAPRIKQGALDTGLQQTAGTAPITVSFTGGTYTLGWGVSSDTTVLFVYTTTTAGYNAKIFLDNTGVQARFQARYINATHPYNLGDGDIALFAYGEIEPSGKVVRVDCSDAPPWYYNGPHRYDPRKVIGRDGKKFQRLPEILAEHGTLKQALAAGIGLARVLDRLATDPVIESEITHAVKNIDMAVIPHPFGTEVKPGNTVVLLNPVGPLTDKLALLHDSPDELSVADLIMNGDLLFDNDPVAINSPPGVVAVNARFKLTA